MVLEATATAGELRVQLDTETPGLATYLIDVDKKGIEKSPGEFLWKLHAGTNRLEAKTRNIAGREGMSSVVVLEYGS